MLHSQMMISIIEAQQQGRKRVSECCERRKAPAGAAARASGAMYTAVPSNDAEAEAEAEVDGGVARRRRTASTQTDDGEGVGGGGGAGGGAGAGVGVGVGQQQQPAYRGRLGSGTSQTSTGTPTPQGKLEVDRAGSAFKATATSTSDVQVQTSGHSKGSVGATTVVAATTAAVEMTPMCKTDPEQDSRVRRRTSAMAKLMVDSDGAA